ncbi:MAG: CinA family nicotinamide mononucleotide deamidase-related protein [Prevotellaceae bacterium]|jgi:nicotinamide-nucleotide amidase|nr:CinA family nicotinamide mononucleotide deamidase-related protein [Prevotellaceae bacterium]
MNASIITVGDEILIGQIVDSNSAYIAGQLNAAGIRVVAMHSVGDERRAITEALEQAVAGAGVVILTGGLGPTNDDITKNVLAEFTHATGWRTDAPSLEIIQQITAQRGLPMNRQNREQALVPDNCETLLNRIGTAPGLWFEYQGRIIIALPGVPFEMQALMGEVVRKLQASLRLPPVLHRTVATYGMPESVLAAHIAEWERALPPCIRLAYLPGPLTGVRLRLSVYAPDATSERLVAKAVEGLQALLAEVIYGAGDDTLVSVVGRLLRQRRATVAVAESCTGGKIASLLTSEAGSSAYFKGGIVAYDNAVKTGVLQVRASDILEHGAVSEPVVEQMAEGVRRLMEADYAIATSGIAGPGGGTAQKPVGTVWIAIATPQGVTSRRWQFTNDRLRNIDRAAATALNMLRLAFSPAG